jgi:omega-6 fatty acid desaturase (delta-12 desaturase)
MFKGCVIFLIPVCLYLGFVVVAAAGPTWWVQLLASVGIASQASVLFVIGHDACHGSLTPHARLNRFIATCSLLPALHPYSTWKHTHNGIHHGWTNVRGKEVVYVPFSLGDYGELPRWRQAAERFFRSPLGIGFFYFCAVYLPHELLPNRERGPRGRAWNAFQWERALVATFAASALLLTLSLSTTCHRPLLLSAVCTTVLPGVIYFGLMSFVTYIHHTHPRAPWFDERDFDYFGIVRATVHVEFPRPIEMFLLEILQHTAHHADTRIPLYNLARSQRAIEEAFLSEVVHEAISIGSLMRLFKTCRLFDYEGHRWLGYDGTPLSEPLLGRVRTDGR